MSISTSKKATINTVVAALEAERCLKVTYVKLSGEVTDRVVLPYLLPWQANPKKVGGKLVPGNVCIKVLDNTTSDGRQESTLVLDNIIEAVFI